MSKVGFIIKYAFETNTKVVTLDPKNTFVPLLAKLSEHEIKYDYELFYNDRQINWRTTVSSIVNSEAFNNNLCIIYKPRRSSNQKFLIGSMTNSIVFDITSASTLCKFNNLNTSTIPLFDNTIIKCDMKSDNLYNFYDLHNEFIEGIGCSNTDALITDIKYSIDNSRLLVGHINGSLILYDITNVPWTKVITYYEGSKTLFYQMKVTMNQTETIVAATIGQYELNIWKNNILINSFKAASIINKIDLNFSGTLLAVATAKSLILYSMICKNNFPINKLNNFKSVKWINKDILISVTKNRVFYIYNHNNLELTVNSEWKTINEVTCMDVTKEYIGITTINGDWMILSYMNTGLGVDITLLKEGNGSLNYTFYISFERHKY